MSKSERTFGRRAMVGLVLIVATSNLLLGAAAQSDAPASTQDMGWPRQVSKDGAQLVYYQPQVDEWKDYKELLARVAFSLTPQDGKQVLGVASLQAGTLVTRTLVRYSSATFK